MRRSLLFIALLPFAAACGGPSSADRGGTLARAEDGLRRLGSTPVHLKVSVQTPVPVERSLTISANQLPTLDLTRWAKNPKRISCPQALDCVRADVDVEAAMHEFGPMLPSLPVHPSDVHDAKVEVAVDQHGRTRYLHLHGNVNVPVLGSVPFEAALDVPS